LEGIKNYLMDMDGVLLRGSTLIPGAADFVHTLQAQGIPFLILTNNSLYTPRDLQMRLRYMGLNVAPENIFTSALATALFLNSQRPGGRAYVLGESGLTTALHDIGSILTDRDPEYVVLGETMTYSIERITLAIRFISAGARFIATNPDVMGPGEGGIVPATGAVASLISAATGVQPYYIGKPNPLMMRTALRTLKGAHSENSVMVGDRMDTDIISGLESGLRTILVLTGVTSREQIERYPYQPTWVRESIAEVEI
jgi:NagD protein